MMKENWVYCRGDIYCAKLDPVVGSEQGGIRPVIVIQNRTWWHDNRRMSNSDDRRMKSMSEKNNILDNDGFLGKGWNFPPTLTENGVKMVSYEEDIQQSLYVLLSTSPSERVNRYDYGCPLRKYAFEVMDTEIVTQMRNDITRAVMLFEPRITLEEVSFEKKEEEGVLLVKLIYTIVRTNNRSNMVYPFYLNEGTNLNNIDM